MSFGTGKLPVVGVDHAVPPSAETALLVLQEVVFLALDALSDDVVDL